MWSWDSRRNCHHYQHWKVFSVFYCVVLFGIVYECVSGLNHPVEYIEEQNHQHQNLHKNHHHYHHHQQQKHNHKYLRRSHRSHYEQSPNDVVMDAWEDLDRGSNSRPNAILPGPVKGFTPHRVFLSDNCTVVLAQMGSTSILHCEVDDIGESTVSWIRRKDYHLLTVGLATYSSDDRFFTAHVKNPEDWALHVRFAHAGDGGLYECQVSTHPPTSLFVQLQLIEAQAEILGGPDKFVKSGSLLRLTCVLRRSTEAPVYVFWYHEERMINYDLGRGVKVRHARYSSELVVAEAHKSDSGNYSCVPSNARPANINVHILNGEEPAAMQHGSKSFSISLTSRRRHRHLEERLFVFFLLVITFALQIR